MSGAWLLGILVAGAAAHSDSSESSDVMCYSNDDCAHADECFTVECVMSGGKHSGECQYSRLPVDECCLTSEECCAFATDFQVGICDKNCTCQFASSLQCVDDSGCEGLLSSQLCVSQGECYYPHCDAGLCECHNGTGGDLDGDAVSCPDDCDDRDADVSATLVCLRDHDNDHYADCYCGDRKYKHPHHHHHHDGGAKKGGYFDDDDDGECCQRFCVEVNHTCPYGWADPLDPERFQKPRSQRGDSGVACTADEINATQPDESECDCCDRDKRAFPGSMYASDHANNCREADYNCNGIAERTACCQSGQEDQYGEHDRTLWYTNECIELDDDDCGGCSTSNGQPVLEQGWACSESCSQYNGGDRRKRAVTDSEDADTDSTADEASGDAYRAKRTFDWAQHDANVAHRGGKHSSPSPTSEPGECPDSCNGECVCVDESTKPALGECAKLVTDCAEVRPGLYSDVEQCCAVAVF